jgi:hypothetical protein
MTTVSVVWNAYLWSTGRRVTMRHLRQPRIRRLFVHGHGQARRVKR